MHLMLDQNRYMIVFDNQEEAKNAIEILSDMIANVTYEKKNSKIFRREIPRGEMTVEIKRIRNET